MNSGACLFNAAEKGPDIDNSKQREQNLILSNGSVGGIKLTPVALLR
jgi:hypothetical protein